MSEHEPEVEAAPVVKVRRDLREIAELAARLEAQAQNKANDRLMPGGLAMVALAAVASPAEWSENVEAAEWRALALGEEYPDLADDDEWEPPLQTLLFWSEGWRVEHGYDISRRPTIATETNFLRWCTDWAWDNEPHFDDFATDVRHARLRLENVLYAGKRVERTRVHCQESSCEARPRLIKLYGETPEVDGYKCPACKRRLTPEDFKDAFAKQLRSTGAERWVKVPDAVGTLRGLGRAERTIRKWFAMCEVEAYCDVATHETWVWWPDLWRMHLITRTRARAS